MLKKPFIALAALLLLTGAGCAAKSTIAEPTMPKPDQIVCTMDAKQCPDGSYVGRSGPNCEFTACPQTNR